MLLRPCSVPENKFHYCRFSKLGSLSCESLYAFANISTSLYIYLIDGLLQPSERTNKIQFAKATMARIGRQILSDSKAAVAASEKAGEKDSVRGHDLLSLLVRANTATDLSDNQRMSDEDVLARRCFIAHSIRMY